MVKSIRWQVIIFFLIKLGLIFWPILGDPLVSQNPREFFASHIPKIVLIIIIIICVCVCVCVHARALWLLRTS